KAVLVISIGMSSSKYCLHFLLLAGPHPRSLSLGGALRALHSVASLGPQALFPCPFSLLPFPFFTRGARSLSRADNSEPNAVGIGIRRDLVPVTAGQHATVGDEPAA